MPNFQEMSGLAQGKEQTDTTPKSEKDEKAEAKPLPERKSPSKEKVKKEKDVDNKKAQSTSKPVKREDSKKELTRVKEVKDAAEFDLKLKAVGDELIVVDFYATWCAPCKMAAPQLDRMAEEFKDVVFLKVDIDDNEALTSKYDVTTLPTFVFIKNGKVVESVTGSNMTRVEENLKRLKSGEVRKMSNTA